MAEPATSRLAIDDPDFAHAVELIDRGDAGALRAWVAARPHLLTARANDDQEGEFAGSYFARPKLLWFVAENPVRNGVLPDGIANVTRTLVELAEEHRVPDRQEQLDYTLSLVMSGRVARECGAQRALAEVLVAGGADPAGAFRPALAHRELDAAAILLDVGAPVTVAVAAALGREEDLDRLKRTASDDELREALVLAACNGQDRTTRILADMGTDPNQFNPQGLHAHCTPLHLAVQSGSVSTVAALVTRGADPAIEDRIFGGTARGWARHAGHTEVLAFLDEADIVLPAISAVREGRVEDLRAWLEAHADRVDQTLGDNPRTLLHYATDWPGFPPRVGETIALLAELGADVNARYVGPATSATETPLHWAASSDDVEAAEALIAAGADLDATGGVLGNGTPLVNAVVFQCWRVAEALVAAGASISLPLVAGMGRMDLVATFFDESGRFRNPHPSLPHQDTVSDGQHEIDQALCLAARGGRLEAARRLVQAGANLDAVSPAGTTPLDEALANDHPAVAAYLKSTPG